MNTHFIKTFDDVKTLLSQEACLEPSWESRDECYPWIEQTLSHFKYRALSREGKGLIRRYLTVASGYSTAQVTPLINHYSIKALLSGATLQSMASGRDIPKPIFTFLPTLIACKAT